MKGLSPVIAVVLLIAFTVAVAGLVSIFFTELTTSRNEETSKMSAAQQACSGVRLQVDRVTDGGVVFSNPSVRTITDITVYDESGMNLTFNATDLSPAQVTNITWDRGGNTSIFMRGICEGSIVVEGSCEVGRVCWK